MKTSKALDTPIPYAAPSTVLPVPEPLFRSGMLNHELIRHVQQVERDQNARSHSR